MVQIGGVQRPLEIRRSEIARVEATQGGFHRLLGLTEVLGTGEGYFDTPFPVRFVGHPSFSFGGELGDNEPLVKGSYPEVDAFVVRWDTVPNPQNDKVVYYRGARISFVAAGRDGMRWFLHWQFEAMALRNPLGGTFDTNTTI